MSDASILFGSLASMIGNVWTCMDSVYFSGYSLLDIAVGLEFFASTIWFLSEILYGHGPSVLYGEAKDE